MWTTMFLFCYFYLNLGLSKFPFPKTIFPLKTSTHLTKIFIINIIWQLSFLLEQPFYKFNQLCLETFKIFTMGKSDLF